MSRCWRMLVGGLWSFLGSIGTSPAGAHGFGQRYDLPIPLAFYVWGAGAAVALSFLGFALFLRREPELPRVRIGWHPKGLAVDVVASSMRALTVAILVLVIAAGLLGNQDPIRNIAPVMIWIVGWVGLTFACMLLGDLWALINPWNTVFALAENCYRRIRAGAALGWRWRYPEALGVWPAVVLFMLFAWMELVWSGRNVPAELAAAVVVYSGLTWAGMFAFGRDVWLRHGEAFALVFGIFARFAPLAGTLQGGARVVVQPPGVGLLEDRPMTISLIALVIALLATVTFDGFLETPLWSRVDLGVLDWASDAPFWTASGLREDQAVRVVRTVALIGCLALFLAAYAAVCWLTAAVAGDRDVSAGMVARRFVLTLVPISLAYHVAHYFSLLFIGGQYAIPLSSDPLGRGWNLFGTASYQVDIGLVAPRLQWTVAVVAVVLGHVIAVYLSHVTALRVFRSRDAALRGQIPMALLMVAYTMVSLWILSQPIVETGTR